METMLREYGEKCTKPHEMQTAEGIQKRILEGWETSSRRRKRSRLGILSRLSDSLSHPETEKRRKEEENYAVGEEKDAHENIEDMEEELKKVIELRARRAKETQTQWGRDSSGGDGQISPSKPHPVDDETNQQTAGDNRGSDAGKHGSNAFASLAAALAGDPSPSKKAAEPRNDAEPEQQHTQLTLEGSHGVYSSPQKQPIDVSGVETPSVPTLQPVTGSAPAVPLLEAARTYLVSNGSKNGPQESNKE